MRNWTFEHFSLIQKLQNCQYELNFDQGKKNEIYPRRQKMILKWDSSITLGKAYHFNNYKIFCRDGFSLFLLRCQIKIFVYHGNCPILNNQVTLNKIDRNANFAIFWPGDTN